MSRRLLALNVVLGIVSVALAVGIARTLLVKRPVRGPATPRAASAPPPAAAAEAGDAGPAAYGAIAARNLFNPARSETAAAVVAKPILHGVVIDGARSRAFLEDPAAKRVAGYSVGDTVGGGKIQKITDDRVVIARPQGSIEVLLQDPSKPRAAAAATATPTVTTVPGQVVPQGPAVPPGQLAPSQPVALPNQAPPTPPQARRRVPGLIQGQPPLE
jgi:hypothetical protein